MGWSGDDQSGRLIFLIFIFFLKTLLYLPLWWVSWTQRDSWDFADPWPTDISNKEPHTWPPPPLISFQYIFYSFFFLPVVESEQGVPPWRMGAGRHGWLLGDTANVVFSASPPNIYHFFFTFLCQYSMFIFVMSYITVSPVEFSISLFRVFKSGFQKINEEKKSTLWQM